MPVVWAVPAFVAGAVVSLATSWILVSRLERVGERLGFSEALLGLVAALAADAPEVTAAVTAMAGHQQRLGAGVIIGSNVFNLAALLGLGAVVAGRVRLHRKVVVLGGAMAMWIAFVCLVVVLGIVPAVAGLVLTLVTVALYGTVLGLGQRGLARLPLPAGWISGLQLAVAEEESELEEAIRPEPARGRDVAIAAAALLVVVVASVTMERAASALGSRYVIPEIVVGGLVLAAVTSLPNAVAAVYLAARGRGAATLSTALNSNTLNVTIGLLLPAAIIGLGPPTGQTTLIAGWYIGLTAVTLAFAYRDGGISRGIGSLVIAAYLVFTGSVLVSAYAAGGGSRIVLAAGAAVLVVFAGLLAFGRRRPAGADRGRAPEQAPVPVPAPMPVPVPGPGPGPDRESMLPGWSVQRLWALALVLPVLVAATDAALGRRVVLIGLLIIGPCCAVLTGRWVVTGLTGLWVIGLAVVLGVPDGIWGTSTQLVFLAAVTTVAGISTLAAAVISIRKPPLPR
jgi:cation:H+ antiporter